MVRPLCRAPLLLPLLLAALGWLAVAPARAQVGVGSAGQRLEAGPPSSRRCRWLRLAPGRDTTRFAIQDTLTVVPGSVTLGGESAGYDLRRDQYRYVRPPGRPVGPDSVLLCYRVLPLSLTRARFRRPRRLMDSIDFRGRPMLGYEDFSQKEQILNTPGISKTGNLSRGVSFGNTQSVFVNSALNLQLEGQLTDKIHLTAAISDQNVPFQPEGNTQTLQQFDRIYITLTGPQWNLTAGDVVLRNKPDYFLRYYKNIQGAAVEANLGAPAPAPLQAGVSNALNNSNSVSNAPPSSFTTYTNGVTGNSAVPPGPVAAPLAIPGTTVPAGQPLPTTPAATSINSTFLSRLGPVRSSTLVAGGVAKGKFASLDLTPLDNVQGPYRLTGPNGEQFIIVLAGSERVYLDGRLQVRGFDYDYVIDYNLAEITFSPRHVITRNTRLKVDFEYSDLNYSRSLYTLSHYQQVGKLQARVNFYQEADDPNNLANLSLGTDDLRRLRGAGNVSQVQVAAGTTPTLFNRSVVQYHLQPVTVNGQTATAFVYATDSLTAVYTVRFTDVGEGQGSYAPSTRYTSANGRVYEFVGAGRGRYQPVRILPTPLLKQMLSGGATYQLDPTAAVFVDLASSQLQRNRFDTTGVRAQTGGAMRLGYTVQDRALPAWVPAALHRYRLRSALDYEYTAAGFAPIDRYRDVEFDRNWSAASTANATTAVPPEDNIFNFAVGLSRDAAHALNYRVSRRYRPGEVSGVQHWVDAAEQIGKVELRGSLFVLSSQAGLAHSDWARGEASVRYLGGRLIPGYVYRFDKNQVLTADGSQPVRSANYFDEHAFSLASPDTGRTRYRLDYGYRRDRTPTAEQANLDLKSIAQTVQGSLNTRLGRTQDLRLLATYRDVQRVSYPDSARVRNILAKLDYNVSLLQNQLRSELSYSVQTGRELRRDYSFLAVPAGQGTHYYAGDLNHNGVQDKDEFLEAQTPDAQYRTFIKVYLPTADYITAYQNRLSYRLTANAPRPWFTAGGWRQVASRLSTVSSFTADRRTTSDNLGGRLNPLSVLNTDEDRVLAFNQLLRQTVYLNRASPTFGAEVTVQQTQQKTLLSQGFDLRNLSTQSLLVRRTLAQSFTGRLLFSRDIRQASSTYSNDPSSPSYRNFALLIYTVQPEVSYQPSPALRLTGSLLHTTKQNVQPERPFDTAGTFDDAGLELRLSQVSKRTVTASTHVTRVDFQSSSADGVASTVGLEVLQALRPGTNFTWSFNLEQRLTNGLNINVAYDGRKASGTNVVHTGRMQATVLF